MAMVDRQRPIGCACDVFLQDSEADSVDLLAPLDGQFRKVAEGRAWLGGLLSEQAFVIEHFAVHLVAPLLQSGNHPKPGKLRSLKILPALGCERDRPTPREPISNSPSVCLGEIREQVSCFAGGDADLLHRDQAGFTMLEEASRNRTSRHRSAHSWTAAR